MLDGHTHIWPAGLRHPAQRTAFVLPCEADDLVAALDRAGIERAIVIPASVYRDNDWVVAAAGRSAGRLLAVASLETPADIKRVADLPSDGVVGVRLTGSVCRSDGEFDHIFVDEAVALALQRGAPIQWTLPLDRVVEVVSHAAKRSQRLVQIVDHLGLPRDVTRSTDLDPIRALAAIDGVYVKLSGMYALSRRAYPYEDTWPWIAGVLDAFGADRMLWASDWPLSAESAPYIDQLALLGRLPFLSEDDRRRLTDGRLFDLGRSSADAGIGA